MGSGQSHLKLEKDEVVSTALNPVDIEKWRGVLESTLSILRTEGVLIRIKKKLGFVYGGLSLEDTATDKALSTVRMYGTAEASPLNTNVGMLNDTSYPFHMIAVLALANGEVFRESTLKAFKLFDETWIKIKTAALMQYKADNLKIMLPEALAMHAVDAPVVYKRLLLLSMYRGLDEKKVKYFIDWVEEVTAHLQELKGVAMVSSIKQADACTQTE